MTVRLNDSAPSSDGSASGATRTKRLADGALVAFFLAFIGLPFAGMWRANLDEEEIARTERRQASAFPTLEFRPGRWLPRKHSLKLFPRGFDAWFNDRVGFRRQFIQAYNLARVTGLASDTFVRPAVGQAAQCPVIIGREGWLFFSGEGVIDDYRCTRPFTPQELDQWKAALTARRLWLEERGIRYIVTVAPNKHTIYSEFLPRSVNRVGPRSRLDQLIEHLSGPDGVEIVDLRGALREGKAHCRTYHRTDTHWNEYGAYLGYRCLMARIQNCFEQLSPRKLDEFAVVHVDREGDYLAVLLDSPLGYREDSIHLVPKQPRRAALPEFRIAGDATPYRTSTCADAELERAVVLHDSFFVALAPFLSEHFERVHYVWTSDFPTYVIERERPQVVIHEFVERKLMNAPPENSPEVSAPLRLAGSKALPRARL